MAIVSALVSSGCSLTSPGQEGNTALHCAAQTAQLAVVQLCLASGVEPDCVNDRDETPLHLVAEFFSRGLFPSHSSGTNQVPLQITARRLPRSCYNLEQISMQELAMVTQQHITLPGMVLSVSSGKTISSLCPEYYSGSFQISYRGGNFVEKRTRKVFESN